MLVAVVEAGELGDEDERQRRQGGDRRQRVVAEDDRAEREGDDERDDVGEAEQAPEDGVAAHRDGRVAAGDGRDLGGRLFGVGKPRPRRLKGCPGELHGDPRGETARVKSRPAARPLYAGRISEASHMERFWNARARENAPYFVDNRLDYRHGDLAEFWAGGEKDLERLLEIGGVSFGPTDRVLDIGCGVGRLTRAAAARAGFVTGIDISAEMVSQARANLAGLGNVELQVGDGTSLRPIPDASVDAVISHVVFQHIPDPAITLGYVGEIGRVLRSGGWATFQVSNDPSIHAASHPRPSWLKRALGLAPRGLEDRAWKGSAVDLAALREAASAAGMTVERMSGAGSQYCIVTTRKS